MSETVEVFAGDQGASIPVAGRTDDDGNKVQLVELDASPSELSGTLAANSFLFIDVDAYTTLFLNVGTTTTIQSFDSVYELVVVTDDDDEIGNVPLFDVHTSQPAPLTGSSKDDPVSWYGDISPYRRVRLQNASAVEELPYWFRFSKDGPPGWSYPKNGIALPFRMVNADVIAVERWEDGGASGAITANDEVAFVSDVNEVLFQIDGTFDGTLVPEISVNGSTWVELSVDMLRDVSTGLAPDPFGIPGVYLLTFGAWIPHLRVRGTSWNTGTAQVTFSAKDVTAGA